MRRALSLVTLLFVPLCLAVSCLAALSLAAQPAFAEAPGAIGYGRHALRPPRHDLRSPPLGADGAPVRVPHVELGDVPPDRSLPRGPQSTTARHVNWCRARYRSYEARTDTFVPRPNAPRVRCASPFRR